MYLSTSFNWTALLQEPLSGSKVQLPSTRSPRKVMAFWALIKRRWASISGIYRVQVCIQSPGPPSKGTPRLVKRSWASPHWKAARLGGTKAVAWTALRCKALDNPIYLSSKIRKKHKGPYSLTFWRKINYVEYFGGPSRLESRVATRQV